MAGPYAFLHRRKVAQQKSFRPQIEGSDSFLQELLRQERAREPAPGERFVGGQSAETPSELRKAVEEVAHGRDSLHELGPPLRRVEVLCKRRHRAPVRVELATRVSTGREDLDRPPRRPSQLGLVERNALAGEEHQRHLGLDRLSSRQPLLELLEEGSLRRTLHSRENTAVK